MKLRKEQLRLYLVTDSKLCSQYGLEKTIEEVASAGVSIVQLRDKNATTAELISQGKRLLKILRPYQIPLIVNDNVDATIAVEADGLHLGESDMNPDLAREKIGNDAILGLSCGTLSSMQNIQFDLVDYIGIGPIFSTSTKTDHSTPVGFSGLMKLCRLSKVPVVAIGGLKQNHCKDVFQAGADGVAVVSAICGKPDPYNATYQLVQTIQQIWGI